MTIQAYLFFNGNCEEAIAFYSEALGAEVTMKMRFKESPQPTAEGCMPAGSEDKIMHACLRIGDTNVMASDGGMSMHPAGFSGFSLSYSAADEAQAKTVFARLSEGGKVNMPLAKTFYSPCFGMLEDRFGVAWMVIVPGA